MELTRRNFVASSGSAMPASLLPEVAGAQTAGLAGIDVGDGPSALVFLHGFSTSHTDWNLQVGAFADKYRCIALDMPCHGQSASQEDPSIEGFGKAIAGSLKQRGVEKAVFIGHSLGCRTASEMHRSYPEMVQALIFIEGSILGKNDPESAVKHMQGVIDKVGIDGFVDAVYADFFVASSPQYVRDFVMARRKYFDPDMGKKLPLNMVRWEMTYYQDTLASIDVPVLAIQSTAINSDMKRVPIEPGQDTPFTKALSELVAGVQIERVSGVGHFVMLEAENETNGLISDFAASV